ncbi:transketolase [Skermanella stibiiresistens SB22]|uniref:Transketolase n=1 Tax=Skermanella stibiiresistens SB22 TaxID=1385369 RepID=W9HCT4_9PROT|nr:transketolase [Skermanella stibiiresistens]EWY42517.1 transketolase [Skermanella stibiiresistens SB22]
MLVSDTDTPTASVPPRDGRFDVAAARRRCLELRHRILDLSRNLAAMHIAPAFSCLEMVDAIYFGLMRRDRNGASSDTFILSKGHGCMAQYAVLERLGVLSSEDLELNCKPEGRLGGHPDYGTPGIEASTGSLGHGLAIGLGMAYADKLKREDRRVFVLVGDGEMQEGSVWEALMMAANLGLDNLVCLLDLNDFQGLGRTSETHPHFYPIVDKIAAFGWEVASVDGHDAGALVDAFQSRRGGVPFFVVGRTIKGRGVAFMENVPIWHYRSPDAEEYRIAKAGLREVGSGGGTAPGGGS